MSSGSGAGHVVGLAVGRGTGAEVAGIFGQFVDRFAELYGRNIRVERASRTYDSYVSLARECAGIEEIRHRTREDAEHYERFLRERAAAGTPVVFRTAINAQTLYLVRQRLRAVKEDVLDAGGARLLLVRDQAQGFYTGENEHSPGRVRRVTEFSRETTEQVLHHAVRRARQVWPGEGPARIVMAYKFHLLDGALDRWVSDFGEQHGVDVRVFQPDTVNRNLIAHGPEDRTVLVAGNEWGDIMHVVLLDRFGAGRQEEHCTRNVHLHPDVEGLVEYQTVHGSADDLEGLDLVNPLATVRAAAAVVEGYAECGGAVAAAERALAAVARAGVRTPDLGGRHSSGAVVSALLDALAAEAAPVASGRPAASVGSGSPAASADPGSPAVGGSPASSPADSGAPAAVPAAASGATGAVPAPASGATAAAPAAVVPAAPAPVSGS
ncbi:isocitrate dehydrogenase family protein [Streptomyces albus]|uniref:Isocitrate dehydrogenase family protein n=1 Tax=Streptomyces albus (strain ATCC 21838 / DSM 41398 / FERM P-419 / JCM 4703 / NBRC 107858) TaxID=1081613 RepID=A0A0B5ETQ5_STRA4|nr:isocitrate dehydrogenase family protein [Streptomyces albus]AOU75807.1 isocitrate dehydrogenase family protein [Streptomyces albus]AYN31611.1 isocitrate dehydrogenase [Streptomyces albus]